MGTAVLEDGLLVHHSVVSLEQRGAPHEIVNAARSAIARLLACHQPAVLVIEKTFFGNSHHAILLNLLAREIRSMGESHGLAVVGLAPSTVKKELTGDGHASKRRVAAAVCKEFPQLKAYQGQNRKWKARYHSNRFDAVGLALVCSRRRCWLRW